MTPSLKCNNLNVLGGRWYRSRSFEQCCSVVGELWALNRLDALPTGFGRSAVASTAQDFGRHRNALDGIWELGDAPKVAILTFAFGRSV